MAAAAAAAAALKVTFPGMPDVTARLFLYTGVSQGTKLQNDIRSGKAEQHLIPEVSRRDHLAVAFLDARRVVGITALQAAVHKAVVDQRRNALVTRSLASEVLCNLSGTKQVVQSFAEFGVRQDSDDVLVCVLNLNGVEVEGFDERLHELVGGTPRGSVWDVVKVDEARLRKWYKITDEEAKLSSLDVCACCRIACRDL